MIRIIAGGKKHADWVRDAVFDYEKRLQKPFDIHWEIMEEPKLKKYLDEWKFKDSEVVIIADEGGKNISSPELADKFTKIFNDSFSVVIIIGGAYGISDEALEKADFLWSFSNLVFPHQLMRVMVTEQIYRAQEITRGSKYHHA